ncbi:MAG TPA: 50S ribosomal protein L3 [Candidatus Sulfobium mesophilum]|jgi:large subunit ribosomal protein L3|uniref:Large ribosomal subunit protein uL3 n=1 Tax=Candidatus Sulfobium mesophilum TaxID=2016548 RepID=A0A2U3QE52_9BACT|nr:50S ribosomal subunit protein L3 [Candidatus Sulfobium mesophilum]HSB30752.1 50S ribosomal protein L3 [Candidatus Sulfobium mesophilum]
MIGILGRKLGMTQVFDESGRMFPVTVVEAGPCCVVQVKTREKDGYEAVKVGFSEVKKAKKVNKPLGGVFKKVGLNPYKMLREFPMGDVKVGEFVTVEKFKKGDLISVSGVTKGKGFQGVVKRHHYAGGPASHGSMFYRAPGSIGASSFPSRVWKNKGLPGHMGSERVTVKNLKVVDIRAEQNLLLILGAVPGSKGTYLEIRKEN